MIYFITINFCCCWQEVKKFVLDIGAEMPTRIELVMVKDKLSTWYVTFRDMNAALNSFSMFHNKQAVYKGHNIGVSQYS